MANTSISQLTDGTPVTDTDLMPDVQTVGLGPVKVTAAQLKTYIGTGLTLTNPILVGGINLGSYTFKFPTTQGVLGQVLVAGGSGTTTWTNNGVTSVNASGGTTGLLFTGGPITTSGSFVLSGVLGIANGGTGATSATQAILNLLPAITPANTGYALFNTGNSLVWSAAGGGGSVSVGLNGGSTGLTVANTPVLGIGTMILGGVVNIASGGTGATTAAGALTNLLPPQVGNTGKFLTTNGSVTSWATVSSAATPPGGATTAVQYNNAGAFGGDAVNFNYNSTTSILTLGANAGNTGSVRLLKSGSSGAVSLQGGGGGVSWVLTFPTNAGTNGQVLTTNGSGLTSWSTITSGGTLTIGTTTITNPGSQKSILFDNSGILGEATNIFTDGASTLFVGKASIAGLITIGASNANTVTIQPAASPTATWTLSLPASAGTNGQVLTTNGSGVTSWTSIPSSNLTVNSTAIVGGATGRMVYDNAGTFGEATNVTTDGIGGITVGTSGALQGSINFGSNSAFKSSIRGSNLTANNWTLTLPINAGSSGQLLRTDGAGNTSWVSAAQAANLTGAVQYNAGGGTFGGDANNFIYDPATAKLSIGASSLGAKGSLVIRGNDGVNAVTLQTSSAVVGGSQVYTFTFPPNVGTAGQYLVTDGTGITTWTTPVTNLVVNTTTITGGGTGRLVYDTAGKFGEISAIRTDGIATLTMGTLGSTQGSLVLNNTTPSFNTTIKSSNSSTAAWTLTLPVASGANGQVLTTNGAGVTSWTTPVSGLTVNTTTITGGTSGRMVFDNAGTVGETSAITTNGAGTLTLGTISTTQGSLVLNNSSPNSVTVRSSNSTSAAWTFTLPTSAGTAGQVLLTNGFGVTSWTTGGVTIGTTAISLGGSSLTLAGLTSVAVTQDPVSPLQLATKQYVDANVDPLNRISPVNYASIVDVPPTGAQTVDGSAVTTGQRVLLTNNSTGSENGIWQVDTAGAWIRPADADVWAEIVSATVFVLGGSTLANSSWVQVAPAGGTMGSTTQTWLQQAGLNSYSAGLGINIASGSVIENTGIVINSGGTTGLTYTFDGVTGTSTLGGTLAIANGGTGATTRPLAINNLLPDQAPNNGKYLITDGTDVSWAAISSSGTVNTGVAGQLAYYDTTGTAVSGTVRASINAGALTLGASSAQGSLVLAGSTSGTVTVTTIPSAGTWTLTLPDNEGAAGEVLVTDGNGVSSWGSAGLVVGTSVIGSGPSGNGILYNDGGVLGQASYVTTDGAGKITAGLFGATLGTIELAAGGASASNTTIQPSSSQSADWTLTLPSTGGTNGYFLKTDGTGLSTWADIPAQELTVDATVINGGGSGRMVFDNAGTFGEATGITTDGTGTLNVGDQAASIAGSLVIANGAGASKAVTIISSPLTSGAYTLTLPTTDGSSNQVLQTDGSGVLSWATFPDSSLVVDTTVITGGTNGRIVFDNNGKFGEAVNISTDGAAVLRIGTTGFLQGSLILANTSAFAATIKSSNSTTANWTLTLPTTAGTLNQVLATDGLGVTSWITPAAAAVPGGNSTAVQYNNAGAFGGDDANFSYNSLTAALRIGAAAGTGLSGSIILGRAGAVGSTIIRAGAAASDWSLTLPTSAGLTGQVLTTNGSGATSWTTPVTGITIGTTDITSGTNGRILFDNVAKVGEASGITTNGGSVLTLGVASITQGLFILSNTTAFSTTVASSNASTTSWTLTLPTTAGTSGQFLQTDGAGATSWAASTTSITPTVTPIIGGTSNRLLYDLSGKVTETSTISLNDAGAFFNIGINTTNPGTILLAGPSAATSITTAATSAWTFKLPANGGTNGQVLTTDGTGTTTWAPASGGITVNSTVIAGGTTGRIAFDNGGKFGEITNITTDGVSLLSLGTAATQQGGLALYNSTNFFTTVKSSNSSTANWTMTLPTTAGSSGQVLTTDGTGTLSWAASPAATITVDSTVINGGTDTYVLFDTNGKVSETSTFRYNRTTSTLSIGVTPLSQGKIALEASTSGSVTIQPLNSSSVWTLTLPTNGGTNGQVLTTNGSGATSWTTIANTGTVNSGTATQLAWYSATGTAVSSNVNATMSGAALTLGVASTTQGSLVLATTGANTATVRASNSTSVSWSLTLPTTAGTTGQALTTDGNGVTSWSTVGSGTVNSGTAGRLAWYSSTGTAVADNSNATISAGGLTLGVSGTTAGTLTLSGNGSGSVQLKTATAAGSWSLTLPTTAGTNGQVLTTDGTGIASWTSPTGSGTVNSGTANQLAFYSATGTAVSGNANATVSSGALTLGASTVAGSITLNGSTSGTVGINTAAAAGSWTLTLPTTGGTNGQVLTTNGSGVTSWVSAPAAALTVGTTVVNSGSTAGIFFNNGGVFSQIADVYGDTAKIVLGTVNSVAGTLSIANAANSNLTSIKAAAGSAQWTLTLPTSGGTAGNVLTTDGSGNTSWTTGPASTIINGLTTITGGGAGRMVYDTGGVFAEATAIRTNGTSTLTIGTASSLQGSLVLANTSANSTTIKSSNNASAAWTLTLPTTAGTANQVLTTDGAGVTSWAAPVATITSGTTVVNNSSPNRILFTGAGSVLQTYPSLEFNGTDTFTIGVTPVIQGKLQLQSISGDCTIQPASSSSTWTLTLPANGGTNGQILTTNGSGVTSWTTIANTGTVNSGTSGQMAFYSATGTAVSGNANATISSGVLTLGVAGTTAGNLTLSGSTSGTVQIKTAAAAGAWSLTLPTTAGTNGQFLQTDGAGVTSWATASGSGTVNSGVANQLAYYAADGNTVGPNVYAYTFGGNLRLGSSGSVSGQIELCGVTSSVTYIRPSPAAGGWTFQLPANAGSAGQVLGTNGSGVTSWVNNPANAVIVGTTPVNGGVNLRVPYNNNGVYGENACITTDGVGFMTIGQAGVSSGAIILARSATAQTTVIQSSGSTAAQWTLTLPPTPGTNGQVLGTNGSGVTSWINSPAGTLTANVTSIQSGTNGSILFDNGGVLGENPSKLFWDNTNNRLGIGIGTPTKSIQTTGDILVNGITVGAGGYPNSGDDVAFGQGALIANVSGIENTAIGYRAGVTMTSGNNNTFVGADCGGLANGGNNAVGVGRRALNSGATNSVGVGALAAFSVSSDAVGVGYSALGSGALVTNSVAVGSYAGNSLTNSAGHVAVGYNALSTFSGNNGTITQAQTAIGYEALKSATGVGYGNTAVGNSAGSAITSGQANTILGAYTGSAAPISATGAGWIVLSDGVGNIGAYAQPLTNGGWFQKNNSSSWSTTSDERLKENIVSLENGLDVINDLRPVEFDYIESEHTNFGKAHEIGFIAQEYAKVLPEQVKEQDSGYLSLQPNLLPYLVKAIQELTAKNEELEARLAKLESK